MVSIKYMYSFILPSLCHVGIIIRVEALNYEVQCHLVNIADKMKNRETVED